MWPINNVHNFVIYYILSTYMDIWKYAFSAWTWHKSIGIECFFHVQIKTKLIKTPQGNISFPICFCKNIEPTPYILFVHTMWYLNTTEIYSFIPEYVNIKIVYELDYLHLFSTFVAKNSLPFIRETLYYKGHGITSCFCRQSKTSKVFITTRSYTRSWGSFVTTRSKITCRTAVLWAKFQNDCTTSGYYRWARFCEIWFYDKIYPILQHCNTRQGPFYYED